MPNGGPDCCGNCGYNRAVQEMAHPHPSKYEEFWKISHCTLRDVAISNPFWSYCDNFRYGKRLPEPGEKVPIAGWITGSGLYEGYVRIPWHGNVEPLVSVPCTCCICGRETKEGITIKDAGETLGFCTNRHYIEWWRTKHDDSAFSPHDYASPERYYADK
jgi:hypothetical protein